MSAAQINPGIATNIVIDNEPFDEDVLFDDDNELVDDDDDFADDDFDFDYDVFDYDY